MWGAVEPWAGIPKARCGLMGEKGTWAQAAGGRVAWWPELVASLLTVHLSLWPRVKNTVGDLWVKRKRQKRIIRRADTLAAAGVVTEGEKGR